MAGSEESSSSRVTIILVATIVTTAIAILLTLLRLYVRHFMIKLLDWDDLFNVLGMVRCSQPYRQKLELIDLYSLRRLSSWRWSW
jgi:hypothetical protein